LCVDKPALNNPSLIFIVVIYLLFLDKRGNRRSSTASENEYVVKGEVELETLNGFLMKKVSSFISLIRYMVVYHQFIVCVVVWIFLHDVVSIQCFNLISTTFLYLSDLHKNLICSESKAVFFV